MKKYFTHTFAFLLGAITCVGMLYLDARMDETRRIKEKKRGKSSNKK